MNENSEIEKTALVSNSMLTVFAVLLTLFSALMIASSPGTNINYQAFTAGSTVFTLLLWGYRINRKGFSWFPRLIALFVLTGIYFAIYREWIESFHHIGLAVDECGCKRSGSCTIFGPLLAFLVIGTLSLNYCIWGNDWTYTTFRLANKDKISEKQFKSMRVLWWCLYVPGLILASWVLVNNFNMELLMRSIKGIGFGILVLVGLVVAFIGFCLLLALPDIRRKRIAKRDYESMPASARESIINTYKDFVNTGKKCNSYSIIKSTVNGDFDITSSKIGGIPYAEEGDSWPVSEYDNDPSLFCMQLGLKSLILPDVWKGRLIVVYCVDWEIFARSYASPSVSKAVDISRGKKLMKENYIQAVEVPFAEQPDFGDEEGWEDYLSGYTVEYALANSEEIATLTNQYTKYPVNLLEFILNDAGYPVLGSMDIILEGGSPNLIQSPHDPVCERCNQAMRFLFEFGEILEDEFTFGDAGMVYIYGCDDHPDNCKGFVDSC